MPTAAEFDEWYADMEHAPVKDEIQQRHLGLPPRLLSTSLLTWDGLAEVVDRLRLGAGDTLVDLACGRGGYGLEVARRAAGAAGRLPGGRPHRHRTAHRAGPRRHLRRRDPVRSATG